MQRFEAETRLPQRDTMIRRHQMIGPTLERCEARVSGKECAVVPLYRLDSSHLDELPATTFEAEDLKERGDLQRILRDHPEVLGDDLFIVSEEFSGWEDSKLRIDLLALSTDGTIVVVELKRTESGGYMELQAIRYAAMVANLTFDQLVETHQRYLEKRDSSDSARTKLIEFLQSTDEDEPNIESARPRILLVSGDFSRELTTSVLWLNDMGLDIRCIRLQPYKMGVDCIVDVQQIIPLPEAEDYLVRVRKKATKSEERTYPEIVWTAEDIRDLCAQLRNPAAITMLDLCAETPEQLVTFSAAMKQAGRSHHQARGDLGALTKLVKSRFRRRNWPAIFDWAGGGEQQAYYKMSPEIAEWWRAARTELST